MQHMSTRTSTHHSPDEAARSIEARLRGVLRLNAGTSMLGGAAALAAGPAVAELLGTDAVGWVRVVGAGLMGFAAFVVWGAAGPADRLHREVPVISIGDLLWVLGSGITITLGWYSRSGAAVIAAVAVAVGTFAVTQATWWRRIGQTTASPTGVS